MNLLADESVDGPIVERLRHDGHQVWYVAEMEPGISDEAVLDLANHEKSLLLTADREGPNSRLCHRFAWHRAATSIHGDNP